MTFPSFPLVPTILSPAAVSAGTMLLACSLVSPRTASAGEISTAAPPDRTDVNRAQPLPTRGQAALTVGLPLFPDKYVLGELAVDIRYGYKFWWLVPYVSGGFRQVRLDPFDYAWEARNRKLRAWHITVGTRIEFPASRKLVPFIGIAVEQSYWAYTEDSTSYCHESWYPESWRCYKAMNWTIGYAVKPQFGLVYKPEPSLGLEFWLEYIHAVAPDMFNRNLRFFSPSVGLAWHH